MTMIKFNVGGRLFETTPSTIACGGADSLLSALSAGYDFSAGRPIFVDRDPDIFSVLLNLLRTNRLPVSSALFRKFTKRELIDEAAFYGLEAHLRSASSSPVLSGIDAQKICTVSPKLQPIPTSFSAASGDNGELLIAHAGLISSFDSSLSATGIFRTHLDRITCLHHFSPKTAAAGSTHAPGIHFYNIASGRLVGSLNWEDETDLRMDKSCVTAIASSPNAVFAGFESSHKENCVLVIDPPTLKPISVINRQSGSSSKTMAVGKLKFLPSSGLLVGSAVKSGSFGTSGYITIWDVRSGESVWQWSEPGSGRSNRFLDPFSDVDAHDETGGIYKVCSRSGDVAVADLRILGRVDQPWVYLEEKNSKLRNCGNGEDSVICCYKREQVFVSRCTAVVNGDHVGGSLEVWSGSSSSGGETEEQLDHHETDRSTGLNSKSYRRRRRRRNYVEREGGSCSCKKVTKMECGGERLFVSRVGLEGVEVWESRVSIDFERLTF